MHQKSNAYDLFTFFSLYIAQSIPMSFFSTALPVMLRQDNFSLSAIGLLQLIKLPWILKFLWSPLVDRTSRTLADYKRWILSSELVYASLIFAVAFLDFRANAVAMVWLIIAAFVASATQDIATDALAVLSFAKRDKGMVNSMQSMGSFGGSIIGAGLLLMLFHRYGNDILPFLAVFVGLALVPLVFNRKLEVHKAANAKKASVADIASFFCRRAIWPQIGFLFLYYSGIIGNLAMLKPWLVDLGYGMKEIGMMCGIAGTSVGAAASLAGGFVVKRVGCGKARPAIALLILIANLYLLALSCGAPGAWQLYGGIALLWGAYGMATIVVYTTAMECVRPGREGTDFTLQTVITHLSGMLMAIICGRIADTWGYEGLFSFESIMALFSLIYVTVVFRRALVLKNI